MTTQPPADISREQFAEIKGYLCGFICSGAASEGKLWLHTLEANLKSFDSSIALQRDLLIELYKQVADDIHQEHLGLQHTLFEKEQSLTKRAYALKKWCVGFLAGLRQAGLNLHDAELQQTFLEKIDEFDGVANLELHSIEIRDEDENAFNEVARHIEHGVLTIYHLFNHGNSKH
ncbi:MAG: UPF0149 family protein [Gammaproteobacteria bacterium]|nr:UPF0149 family protein [Gammaproteobacteria bacterium]